MSPGQSLEQARRRAGLTVTQVSEQTRIRESIIRGIERDDYSACGGNFYARGHIRAMARAIGTDPAPLIEEYDAAQRATAVTDASPGGPREIRLIPPVTPGKPPAPRPGQPGPPENTTQQQHAAPAAGEDTTEQHGPAPASTRQDATRQQQRAAPAAGEDTTPLHGPAPAGTRQGAAREQQRVAPTAGEDSAQRHGPAPGSTRQGAAHTAGEGTSRKSGAAAADMTRWFKAIREPRGGIDALAGGRDESPAPPPVPVEHPAPRPRAGHGPPQAAAGYAAPQAATGRARLGADWRPGERRAAGDPGTGRWLPSVFTAAGEDPDETTEPNAVRPATAGMLIRRHRPNRAVIIGVVLLLAIVVVAAYLLFSGSGPAPHASPAAHPRASGRTHPSPSASTIHSAPAATVRTLHPVSAAAFGPAGTGTGDNAGFAALAIDGDSSTAWETDWYSTSNFNNTQAGTGLLLDMGHAVTITSAQLTLGSSPGADVQLRAGSAPTLADLRTVAKAADAEGTVRLHLAGPVHAHYLLIWFTQLPLDSAGTYQAKVYEVRLRGTR